MQGEDNRETVEIAVGDGAGAQLRPLRDDEQRGDARTTMNDERGSEIVSQGRSVRVRLQRDRGGEYRICRNNGDIIQGFCADFERVTGFRMAQNHEILARVRIEPENEPRLMGTPRERELEEQLQHLREHCERVSQENAELHHRQELYGPTTNSDDERPTLETALERAVEEAPDGVALRTRAHPRPFSQSDRITIVQLLQNQESSVREIIRLLQETI